MTIADILRRLRDAADGLLLVRDEELSRQSEMPGWVSESRASAERRFLERLASVVVRLQMKYFEELGRSARVIMADYPTATNEKIGEMLSIASEHLSDRFVKEQT